MRTLGHSACWAFAVVWLGASGQASACPAVCQSLRTFGNGAFVPGNQVYFKVLVDDPGPLTLKTADGKAIPASIRMIGPDRVYAPIDPIPADSVVVLTYTDTTCGRPANPINYVFQTRAPVDLQLQDAPISAGEYGVVGGSTGPFLPPVPPLAFQRVNYGSPDAASAVTHLLDIDLQVDGTQFRPSYPNDFDYPIEFRALCSLSDPPKLQPSTCNEPIYDPGHHTVTVQPHIVGYADPPPSSLDIDFDRACSVCPGAPPPTAAMADAGMTTPPPASADAGGVAPPPTRADAGMSSNAGSAAGSLAHARAGATPPSAATAAMNTPTAAGGCSATAGRDGGASAWLALFALACLRRRQLR